MDTDKLVKAIQIIVKEEIKTIIPKLVKEGVKKEMAKLLKENKQLKKAISTPKQPTFMEEEVSEQPIHTNKKLSNNPVLNEVLQQTKPFSTSEAQTYAGAPTEVSSGTMKFDTSSTHTLGAQSIAQKMGYGDMQPGGPKKQGLGVTTGLAGLDRVLNRDNSELIKAMEKKKGPWRPGM